MGFGRPPGCLRTTGSRDAVELERGVSLAFPLPYAADAWLKAEGFTLLDDVNTRWLANLMDSVFEQDAMRA